MKKMTPKIKIGKLYKIKNIPESWMNDNYWTKVFEGKLCRVVEKRGSRYKVDVKEKNQKEFELWSKKCNDPTDDYCMADEDELIPLTLKDFLSNS